MNILQRELKIYFVLSEKMNKIYYLWFNQKYLFKNEVWRTYWVRYENVIN